MTIDDKTSYGQAGVNLGAAQRAKQLIAAGTDWRFLNEVKRELKT